MDAAGIERRSPGIHAALLSEPAIDLLATREGDGSLLIQSRRGRARLHLAGEVLQYTVEQGDPFGYPLLPAVLHPDEALQHTVDTQYPDGLYQLAHLFSSPRAGDIVVSATSGYDLRDRYEIPEHKASHGSLHRDHMFVPLATNCPLADRLIRTVDVFPTLLTAMGRATPKGIDGRTAM